MALFTSANAREMAAKGLQTKMKRKIEMLSAGINGNFTVNKPVIPTDIYVAQRLARTRKQISMMDKKLRTTKDFRELKAVGETLARLCEIERILAGRPLPGSNRPRAEKPRRSWDIPMPAEPLPPQPIVSSGPAPEPQVNITPQVVASGSGSTGAK